ncbi:hypothetical protein ANO11243_035110 [Dothideomycetidae sp. 11243]|nr:hypothetical protein ANO11243_035110 [fungal sp. No.11243]
MGLHIESSYSHPKRSPFEAEMGRRVWWSLMLYDARMCEFLDNQGSPLDPTWDCKIPLNVNSFDLRPEMKEPPVLQDKPTESIFAVIRGHIGDFLRYSAFHLDFVNPALKAIVTHNRPHITGSVAALEQFIEEKYLKFCDESNPLHFMTIWSTRCHLAKIRLAEHYSKHSKSQPLQAGKDDDTEAHHALRMLECDAKLISSPLIRQFYWCVNLAFPFPAWMFIAQQLKRRPLTDMAERSWEIMDANYKARWMHTDQPNSPFRRIWAKMIGQAWQARVDAYRHLGMPLEQPQVITHLKEKMGMDFTGLPHMEETAVMKLDHLSLAPSQGLGSGPNAQSQGFGFGNQSFDQSHLETAMQPYLDPQASGVMDMDFSALDEFLWQ